MRDFPFTIPELDIAEHDNCLILGKEITIVIGITNTCSINVNREFICSDTTSLQIEQRISLISFTYHKTYESMMMKKEVIFAEQVALNHCFEWKVIFFL